jgi:chaperonin cofactor prefoldin
MNMMLVFQQRAKVLGQLRTRREEIKLEIDKLQAELEQTGPLIEEARMQFEEAKTTAIASMRDEK